METGYTEGVMSTERSRPIERLASALQDCLDEAAQKGAQEAIDRIRTTPQPPRRRYTADA